MAVESIRSIDEKYGEYGDITNPVIVEHGKNPTGRGAARQWRRACLHECRRRERAEEKLETYEEEVKKRLTHRLKAGWRRFFSSP